MDAVTFTTADLVDITDMFEAEYDDPETPADELIDLGHKLNAAGHVELASEAYSLAERYAILNP